MQSFSDKVLQATRPTSVPGSSYTRYSELSTPARKTGKVCASPSSTKDSARLASQKTILRSWTSLLPLRPHPRSGSSWTGLTSELRVPQLEKCWKVLRTVYNISWSPSVNNTSRTPTGGLQQQQLATVKHNTFATTTDVLVPTVSHVPDRPARRSSGEYCPHPRLHFPQDSADSSTVALIHRKCTRGDDHQSSCLYYQTVPISFRVQHHRNTKTHFLPM